MAKIEFSKPPAGEGEEWRALPLCGAWVSDLGRVWLPAGGLVTQLEARGYLCVRVPGVNGGRPIGVHRLVAHAFHGECPDGMCVDHIDCDQANNRPANLQYVTPSENTRLYWQRRRGADPIAWAHARRQRDTDRMLRQSDRHIAARQALIDAVRADLEARQ